MSDPFSVAAGAVGVISLGIQLCKEISSYTEAWQGYDGDIQSIGAKAESLKTPLKRLRDLVEDTRLTDTEITNDINEKALGLEHQVQRLEKKLNLIKPVFSDKTSDKFRNKLKKVAYPVVTRDALRDIKSDLDSMQSTIQMTLAIFNAQQAQKSQATQEKMVRLIEEIHVTMLSVSSKCMPAPGLLRSLCDRSDEDAQLVQKQLQSTTISQSDIPDLQANVTWPMLVHRNKRKFTTKSVERAYQYHNYWLRRTIKFSFSLSTGAGGFSIAPSLHLCNLLGWDSWACDKSLDMNTFNWLWVPNFKGNVDDLIHDFRVAFSAGKATPSDMLSHGGQWLSLVDVFHSFFLREDEIETRKLTQFLIDCGSIPDNAAKFGFLQKMSSAKFWEADEYTFAVQLINIGGPLGTMPRTRAGKTNMKGLLKRDEELIDLPGIAKAILRESEADLREALDLGPEGPNEVIQGISLLELAVGWPAGVRVLLESGADGTGVALSRSPCRPCDVNDIDCDTYYDSMIPLLQAGCIVKSADILFCESSKVRLLLSHDLVKRRKKLQALAYSSLPSQRLAELSAGAGENVTGIPDIHAFQIYTELLKQGFTIDPSLKIREDNSPPIYHRRIAHVEAWEELYQLGFREIDTPDAEGLTPLMVQLTYVNEFSTDPNRSLARILWLFHKGASLAKPLPYSKGTVAHLASSWMIGEILRMICLDEYDGRKRWPGFVTKLREYRESIFLVPSVCDNCICACCPGGCTTFLVALRALIALFKRTDFSLSEAAEEFRLILSFLVQWTDTRPGINHTIIRSLTFHALGLRHTCCAEIDDLEFSSPRWSNVRDEQDIEDILEEDHYFYHELDRLISEFGRDFDQLGLPIMEFLDKVWHARMIEYLSTPGSYDEEHIHQTRNLGIFLEPHEIDIPDIIYYFGNQVEEVTSDSVNGATFIFLL
ncbi:uncharacterized protein N7496_006003 [Penicillium cataractarum]|uniref:Fungal N-terminal domain-containing protein n=1 Tax=Penicillium cataractarum TaxID=2100454 RepID=A0A9W9V869_9EURO|nr:uncharacterized protein N7496_006003 [Penicillium cataractarum]KAJ5369911.1 hypothetical protein N7496_006003 [Penicillium cataractarum]